MPKFKSGKTLNTKQLWLSLDNETIEIIEEAGKANYRNRAAQMRYILTEWARKNKKR